MSTLASAFKVLVCVFVLAASIPVQAAPVEDVRLADQRRITALIKGDVQSLASVLADELSYGHSDGRVQTKAQLLAALAEGALVYESYEGPLPLVRVRDTSATVTGAAELKAKGPAGPVRFWLRYLAVYELRDGAWVLVAYQSTRLPQAP